MPDTVGGIPVHPLVVHAVVVLVPLAALGLIAIAIVPKWRSRFGILVVIASGLALGAVPLATQSGENLEEVVGESAALERHAELGDAMLASAIPLFVFSLGMWWLGRRTEQGKETPRWMSIAASVLAVLVGLGALVQVTLVGHSGAKAVWGS